MLAGGGVAVHVVVDIAVGDDDVAVGGDGDIGRAVEGIAPVCAGLAGGAKLYYGVARRATRPPTARTPHGR